MIKLTFELEDMVMTATPEVGGADTWLMALDVTPQYLRDFISGMLRLPVDLFPKPTAFTISTDQLAAITALAIGVGEIEAGGEFDSALLYRIAEAALPPDLHRDLRPIP